MATFSRISLFCSNLLEPENWRNTVESEILHYLKGIKTSKYCDKHAPTTYKVVPGFLPWNWGVSGTRILDHIIAISETTVGLVHGDGGGWFFFTLPDDALPSSDRKISCWDLVESIAFLHGWSQLKSFSKLDFTLSSRLSLIIITPRKFNIAPEKHGWKMYFLLK